MSESVAEKQPMGGTAILERTETELEKNPGDDECYTYCARKDRITASAIADQAVMVLCGKVWVPIRDPKNSSIYLVCKEVMNSMHGGGSDNPGWPLTGN